MHRPDHLIKSDIHNKLAFNLALKSHNIITHVENGIVTLSGSVESYHEKSLAEKISKEIHGVKGIVNELQVILGKNLKRNDAEIAKAAVHALEWDSTLPADRLKVLVEHGIVTLLGEVDYNFQRENAYRDLTNLWGVVAIINNIKIKPKADITPEQISNRLLSEFQRNAVMDARHIRVEVKDNKVILKGSIRSWAEYNEALHVAWSAPGVTDVDTSELVVDYAGYA